MIKKLLFLVLVGVSTLSLTSCKSETVSATSIKSGASATYDYILVAMDDTGVLYYRSIYNLTPYYNENGHLCRWVDGKIVEIGGDDNER